MKVQSHNSTSYYADIPFSLSMPRYATLSRPLGRLANNPDGCDPGQPRPRFPCLHCGRTFYAEADRTRHLALRMSCRNGEEMLGRMEVAANDEFKMLFDTLVSALEEMKGELGTRSDTESEAIGSEVEMEGTGTQTKTEGPEVEMRGSGTEAVIDQTKAGQQTATPRGKSMSTGNAGSDAETAVPMQNEYAPTATSEPPPLPHSTRNTRQLQFDKKENIFIEPFPDSHAGAPINDNVAPAPNLDEYMAAAGNLGNPFHFDTAELLMTTGLTAAGRDEHLESHLYVGNVPWKNNKELMEDIDNLPHGPGWEVVEIVTKRSEQMSTRSYLFTRNIVDVVLDIMADPAFKEFMHYAPERHWTTAECQSRVYGNPWTANWWWRMQMRIPDKSATVVPLIIASDRTRLSMMSGGQQAYPVYITLGNIDKSIRRKSTSHAMVLLAYLPVDEFEDAADADEKARLKNDLTHRAMEIVTEPLRTASNGVEMQCPDGRFRRGYPIVAAMVGDWPEQCMMACVSQSGCPKCIQKEARRGDYPGRARPRNNTETLEALSRYFKTGDLGELEELGLKPWWPWWANLPYVDFAATLMPDVLHQIHQGMIKTHLVRWIRKLMGKNRVDHRFMAMPEAEGMRHFRKGISKLSGQWTGRESREVAKQLLPIVASREDLHPDLAGLTRAILEFSYRSHASRMTDEDVDRLEQALEDIHRFKHIIIRAKFFKKRSRRFDHIPKLHMLAHYTESIREMGTPDNYSTEALEHLHIECAKRGWRASNKVRPTPQMVRFMRRYEALRIHCAHLNAWLGIDGTGRRKKRKRKSRVVYDEDEDPTREGQSTNPIGAAQDTEDEEAEGPEVRLEKNGRLGTDATKHVIYPDPTLSIAIKPGAGRVKGLDIIGEYRATDFIQALHIYLKKNTTRRSLPNFFLPTVHHHFLVWNRLYLHHRPLPFDPEHVKRDVIRARPRTHHLGSAFDVALLLYRKEAFGLDRYRAGRIRVIFSLPKELAWLCDHPLVYVELFNPFSSTTSSYHGMHSTSHALTPEGKRRGAVFSIYDVAAACHLAPQFGKLDPSIQLRLHPDLLEECRHFFLNHFYNNYIFDLVEHWQSVRARAAMQGHHFVHRDIKQWGVTRRYICVASREGHQHRCIPDCSMHTPGQLDPPVGPPPRSQATRTALNPCLRRVFHTQSAQEPDSANGSGIAATYSSVVTAPARWLLLKVYTGQAIDQASTRKRSHAACARTSQVILNTRCLVLPPASARTEYNPI
ncbi:hypothetical protein FS749_016465, partial [Ceratobasidium sp. UAMH 11750]